MATPRALTHCQLALRALQASGATAALCATLYGYRDGPRDALAVSVRPVGRLASLAALLAALALYSAALWALYHVVVLGVWNLAARRPSGGCQRVLDGLHAVCALAAGVLLVSVDAFRDCDGDSARTHCGALRAGAALAFVISALFFVSLASGCLEKAAVAAAIVDVTAAPVGQDPRGTSAYTTLQTSSVRETVASERQLSSELCASDLAELRRGVRFLQCGGSVIVLVNVLLGFKRYFVDTDAVTAAVLALLAAYTSAVFSGWHLLVVDLCELVPPLALGIERAVEALFAALLLATGILFEAMDPVADCGDDCGGSHTAAVTFVFIVAAAFAVDLAFTFTRYRDAKVLTPMATPTGQYHLHEEYQAVPRRDAELRAVESVVKAKHI